MPPTERTVSWLVEVAVGLLKQTGRSYNLDLPSWVSAVNESGFELAVKNNPKLAAKYNDWSVIEALQAIASDNENLPGTYEKIKAVGDVLAGDKTVARAFARRRQ